MSARSSAPSSFSDEWKSCDPALRSAVQTVAELVQTLPPAGSTKPRALLVGGVVRDLLRGLPIVDADVEVYGVSADQLRALLEELFPGRAYDVGRAFSVFKIPLDGGRDLDVSLPRRDSKTGKGHKGFSVEGDPTMTVEEAARRRDFTVNAILADPLTGEVLDPVRGISDLEAGVLRSVDPATFGEDPLRVYRALQFAARLDLTPDDATRELLRTMVSRGDLDELPKERITEEMRKLLLKAEKPSIGFNLAWELGIIERDYPELFALKATPQEPEWHPEGDVWIHTMMVIDEASKIIHQPEHAFDEAARLQVMLGALCHNLGKPVTTEEIEGRIRSRGHEEAGIEPTKSLFARWTFGADAEQAALAIAADHLKPAMLARTLERKEITEEQYANAVRRIVKRIHPTPWQVLIAAAEADFRGRGGNLAAAPHTPGDLFAAAVQRHRLDDLPLKPLLRGEDLLALGVRPGPRMGEIIRTVEEARDRGEVKTREEAIALARICYTSDRKPMSAAHRIVILGAGFGGIETYLGLRRSAGTRNIKITLINRTNYFLFTPLLHEVATGGLGHHNVVEAVRQIIGRDPASFLQAEIGEIDPVARIVHTSAGDVPYDTLVIATGATTAFYGIEGAQEHGFVLKNLSDAIRLRDRLIDLFEEASRAKTSAERKKLLSFAVVGGGATGVEIVTEIEDLFRDTLKRFYADDFKRKEVSLTLVSADPDLLMPFHDCIRRKALEILQRRGITVRLKMLVKKVTAEGLVFADGTLLPAATVVWAAGVAPVLVPPQGMTCDKGKRIMVDEFLRVQGQERVFGLGDGVCCISPNGKPYPMLAQVAVQQGPIVAKNILSVLDGRPLTPFFFRMKGSLVSLGRFQAAAQIGPLHFSGPIAWFVWRTVYFFNFHAWSKRFRIGVDWFVNLFFPRDITRA